MDFKIVWNGVVVEENGVHVLVPKDMLDKINQLIFQTETHLQKQKLNTMVHQNLCLSRYLEQLNLRFKFAFRKTRIQKVICLISDVKQ